MRKQYKDVNVMRQQCLHMVKSITAETMRSLKAERVALLNEWDVKRHDVGAKFASLEASRAEELRLRVLEMQESIDNLSLQIQSAPADSAVRMNLISRQHEILRNKADEKKRFEVFRKRDKESRLSCLKTMAQSYAKRQENINERSRGALAAAEYTRNMVLAAPADQLPAILAELNGEKGGLK